MLIYSCFGRGGGRRLFGILCPVLAIVALVSLPIHAQGQQPSQTLSPKILTLLAASQNAEGREAIGIIDQAIAASAPGSFDLYRSYLELTVVALRSKLEADQRRGMIGAVESKFAPKDQKILFMQSLILLLLKAGDPDKAFDYANDLSELDMSVKSKQAMSVAFIGLARKTMREFDGKTSDQGYHQLKAIEGNLMNAKLFDPNNETTRRMWEQAHQNVTQMEDERRARGLPPIPERPVVAAAGKANVTPAKPVAVQNTSASAECADARPKYQGIKDNRKSASAACGKATTAEKSQWSAPIIFLALADRVDSWITPHRGGYPWSAYFPYSTDPAGAASIHNEVHSCQPGRKYWVSLYSLPALKDGYDPSWADRRPNIHIAGCADTEEAALRGIIEKCNSSANSNLCPRSVAQSKELDFLISWGINEEMGLSSMFPKDEHRLKDSKWCSSRSNRLSPEYANESEKDGCETILRLGIF